MTTHIAFMGSTVDHLYRNCPLLRRAIGDALPTQCATDVDPEGGGICGWCLRVWHARKQEGT